MVYTVNTLINTPGMLFGTNLGLYTDSVAASDPYIVVFKLKEANPRFHTFFPRRERCLSPGHRLPGPDEDLRHRRRGRGPGAHTLPRAIESFSEALREEEFTQTAVFSGMGRLQIIMRERFPFLIPFTLADMVSGFLYAIGLEITLTILGLSDVSLPTIGSMIYWANYYQALLARRWWWLLAPITITVIIVVAFYLISTALSLFLDPRTRLKNLAAKGSGA